MKNIIILNKISEREKAISAVIIANGKQYTGPTHGTILRDLVDKGIVDEISFYEDTDYEQTFYYDNYGEIEYGLFLTNMGRVLTRDEVMDLGIVPTGTSQDISYWNKQFDEEEKNEITTEQLESIFE